MCYLEILFGFLCIKFIMHFLINYDAISNEWSLYVSSYKLYYYVNIGREEIYGAWTPSSWSCPP